MYNLPYFKEKDRGTVLEFIHQHPFAVIAACDAAGKPVATQIPVFIEERGDRMFLTGHMMKQTDHHKALEKNPSVLCLFSGSHCYVSARWYADPAQASTWNYMSVHVRGRLRFLGEKELVDILRKTSLHFEGGNHQSSTAFDNLPEDYRTRLMKAIVAFEVEVEEIDNVFKLSQNRDLESYENIIRRLSEGNWDERVVAAEMEKRKQQLFS